MIGHSMKPWLTVMAALSAFVLISCILGGDKVAGRGSEVENELGVYGRLVGVDGKAVDGAKVVALPMARASSAGDTDTVITDSKGRYAFDSLASGEYNILGDFQSGTLVVLIPEVVVAQADTSFDIGTDTLRAPGSIRGRMLVGRNGKGGVLCVIPGLSRLDLSDDSGRFELAGLPQGRYSVRYSATGFTIAPDSGVEVTSAQATILSDKQLEYDPALNPPEPLGLKAVYDTLNQRVLLTWEAVPVSDLDGFVIYRDVPAFLNPEIVKGGFTKNAFFTDTTFGSDLEREGRDLVYRVKARDKGLNLSLNFSGPAEVHAVSRNLVTTTSEVEVAGLRMGEGSPGDSIRLILRFRNPGRTIREIGWFLDGIADPIRMVPGTSGSGEDTLLWRTGKAGTERFTVRMTDDAGQVWSASRLIRVVEDSPVSMAGEDKEVSIYDSLRLQGEGRDRFGRIVKWEWSISGGPFTDSPNGYFSFQAPSTQGKIACRLRVTDDDGNQSEDSLFIDVVEDRPVVSAGRDTLVSINDRVDLRPAASDGYGRIVSWEWKIGGAGVFTGFPSGAASVTAPSAPGALECILRVVDDDGNISSDTLIVRIALDPPSAFAGEDKQASIGDRVELHATGSDGMGNIISREWDIGGTGIFAIAARDTQIILPLNAVSRFPLVLRVKDDDGNHALDTALVEILIDPPIAIASASAEAAFLGDTIILSDEGSRDRFGFIAKVEWDAGATGAFRDLGPDAKTVLPQVPGPFPCVLRVTDDDGQTGLDTVIVMVLEKGGKAWIRTALWDHPGVANGRAVVFKDRLWLMGPDVMRYSENGRDWFTVKCSLGVNNPSLVVSGNKLWALGGTEADSDGSARVWSSDNGIDWVIINANASYGMMAKTRSVSFEGKIWLTGAFPGRVNSSVDGLAWTASDLPAGSLGTPIAVHDGLMWVLADKTWSSIDGKNWVGHGSRPPFTMIDWYPMFSHAGRLWVIGTDTVTDKAEVWSTADGEAWTLAAGNAEFGRRSDFEALSFKGAMWVLGPEGSWYSK